METSIEFSEPSHKSVMPDMLPREGVAVDESAPLRDNYARELSMWLRSLYCFFNVRNHPFNEAERASLSTRDFSAETRILQTVLMRASQLTLALARGDRDGALADEAETDDAIRTALVEEDATDDVYVQDSSLIALGEFVGDALTVCQALLNAREVSFYSWASFGKLLLRELDHSPAAQRLTGIEREVYPASLHPLLLARTRDLTPDALAGDMRAIFSALAQLLERLSFIEAIQQRDQPLKQTIPVFTLIYDETRALLDLIELRALHIEGLDGAVFDALDGSAYAIGMELRKAFEHELVGLGRLRHARSLYARVESAHGLLRDCFQQSTVTLAQVFDPALKGAHLFKSFQTKLDQSLLLREELWRLLQLVKRAEQERDRLPLAPLLEHLVAFREGSLRYLMYKDWESYERFVEEVAAARGAVELGPVLHRFVAYLETLFGQINMRAVLSDHPFDYTQS